MPRAQRVVTLGGRRRSGQIAAQELLVATHVLAAAHALPAPAKTGRGALDFFVATTRLEPRRLADLASGKAPVKAELCDQACRGGQGGDDRRVALSVKRAKHRLLHVLIADERHLALEGVAQVGSPPAALAMLSARVVDHR